jgi:hypothetical protein
MSGWWGGLAAMLCAAALAACAPLAPPTGTAAATQAGTGAVEVRQNVSGRYIALIGPKAQHDAPYLGAPGTNFFCLRSFVDRQTGVSTDQLYVAASYDALRDWTAARDGAGQTLKFVPISRYQIVCAGNGACSYAEEFAAILPKNELSENTGGFSVTFTDRAGNAQKITVSGGQVQTQLAALSAQQGNHAPAAAAVTR